MIRLPPRSTRCPYTTLFRSLALLLRRVRQELVERRIEKANRRRIAVERAEDAGEVVPLIREQLGKRGLSRVERVRENHLADPDRESARLNSSHSPDSAAVLC